MKLHGWSRERAEAEFLLYEIRMNEKAEQRTVHELTEKTQS
jgi:hypothetical protein